jgi:signal transduction histidine kinase
VANPGPQLKGHAEKHAKEPETNPARARFSALFLRDRLVYKSRRTMRGTLRFKLAAYALTIIVAAWMLGLAAHNTWRVGNELAKSLSDAPGESFQITAHFHATIEDLDYTLLRYIVQDDLKDFQRFLDEGSELKTWIEDQKRELGTQKEREVLLQISGAFESYLAAARDVGDKNRADPKAIDASVKEFKAVEGQSKRLRELGYDLSAAHRASLDILLGQSQQLLFVLRRMMFLALITMMVMCGWLAWSVYRDLIMPLRIKLVESREIIERQEKLASLGVLAAGVAHEIRNPLTAIKARLFTLRRHLGDDTPEGQDAVTIGKEIDRLEKIVREVLQFARPADPTLELMNSVELIREVADLLGPPLKARGIALVTGPVSPTKFRGDPQQLKQTLINLVQNAADAIENGGTVTLRSIDSFSKFGGVHRPSVVLQTTDTGKGIPPEVQKRLFDPFFTTKEQGTGLGLSIVARIIEKHGGALEFQTELNCGTTFGIVLPAQTA